MPEQNQTITTGQQTSRATRRLLATQKNHENKSVDPNETTQ
jgi:hypothetical protein